MEFLRRCFILVVFWSMFCSDLSNASRAVRWPLFRRVGPDPSREPQCQKPITTMCMYVVFNYEMLDVTFEKKKNKKGIPVRMFDFNQEKLKVMKVHKVKGYPHDVRYEFEKRSHIQVSNKKKYGLSVNGILNTGHGAYRVRDCSKLGGCLVLSYTPYLSCDDLNYTTVDPEETTWTDRPTLSLETTSEVTETTDTPTTDTPTTDNDIPEYYYYENSEEDKVEVGDEGSENSQNTDDNSKEDTDNTNHIEENLEEIQENVEEVLPSSSSSEKPINTTTRRPARLFLTTVNWWSTTKKGSRRKHKKTKKKNKKIKF